MEGFLLFLDPFAVAVVGTVCVSWFFRCGFGSKEGLRGCVWDAFWVARGIIICGQDERLNTERGDFGCQISWLSIRFSPFFSSQRACREEFFFPLRKP